MADLVSLAERTRTARYAYERRAGAARGIAVEGERVQAEVARLERDVERHAQCAALLNSIGGKAQADTQEQLEQLVTYGLRAVFSENLSFHVVQSVKASQTVVDFVIRSEYRTRDGAVRTVDTPVMEARGGGMAAVTGFVLRLVVLLLTPQARRILWLDESFGMVSREFEARVAEFLQVVAERAAVQVALVTHSDAYDDAADVRYRLESGPDGMTTVKEQR